MIFLICYTMIVFLMGFLFGHDWRTQNEIEREAKRILEREIKKRERN